MVSVTTPVPVAAHDWEGSYATASYASMLVIPIIRDKHAEV